MDAVSRFEYTANMMCRENFINVEIDFMNVVSRFEYTVNMMCRGKILLMWKQILSMQKNIFDYCEIQT